MSANQLYRLRNPATGRELVMEAEAGEIYRDRETGDSLEIVGKLLPLAPSPSRLPPGGGEPALLPVVRAARPEGPERLPDVRQAHGTVAGFGEAKLRREPRSSGSGAPARGRTRAARMRAVAAACVVLISSATLGACGSSSVSDAMPKSTPEITTPTDTSAEKAAGQATSTSTTSTKAAGTTGEGSSSSEEPSKGEGSSEASKESSSEAAAAGGASAEKAKSPSSESSSKGGSEAAGGSSPTGGASAP